MSNAAEDTTPSQRRTGTTTPKRLPGSLPPSWRPYLELIRLDKPTGTKLMFWPFAWGLTMAAFSVHLPLNLYTMALVKCFAGAFIVRSSACTINDIFDRHIDAGVERTRHRPIPSGRVSVESAVIFLAAQYIIGVAFFYYTLEGIGLKVAIFQLLPLFAIYPLLKRITYWPQAWLGLAMNFGFITAWVSYADTVNGSLLGTMTLGCWCWTMLYDTIYACQDTRDDVKMGVRSTALRFGSWIKPFVVLFAVTFVSALAWAGILNNQGLGYFIISVGGTAVNFLWQLLEVDLENRNSCWTNFERNGNLGWVVWAGIFIDYYLNGIVLGKGGIP